VMGVVFIVIGISFLALVDAPRWLLLITVRKVTGRKRSPSES